MLFAWLKKRRRRQILATPFPDGWLEYLRRNVTHYAYLSEAEQARLRDDLRIFIAEKNWEGCGGLQMTDEIKVTIAAQACLLVLGTEHNYYDRVKSILVYPRGYQAAAEDPLGGGVIVEPGRVWLGEAHYRGPVILSWADVLAESRHPRRGNTVFHEFAHQLDFLNGSIDGTPPLRDAAEYRRWREVMTAEFNRLRNDADAHRPTLLDPYGATNETEFFAVATECFFEQPVELARQHPRLYELLRDYYHQDPARRCADRPCP
ncbi:MAG TPA: M90 family metallopeptidase [Gemmataceae bacterium]|nr:M90 family metallopeptidase [Gemmataceae bacterium]